MIIDNLSPTVTDYITDEVPVEQGTLTYKTTWEKVMSIMRQNGGFTRPNILDNGWFQVNQRSQNSDYEPGQDGAFICDRWKIGNLNGGRVSWGHSWHGLTINANNASDYIDVYQMIPEVVMATLLGKKVTLSYGWPNNSVTVDMPASTPSSYLGICTVPIDNRGYVIFGYNANGLGNVNIRASKGKTVDIDRVKLEVGPGYTLHNDTLPNFADELSRCQRFLYLFPTFYAQEYVTPLLFGQAASTTLCRFYVKNPSKFYTTPSIQEIGYPNITYQLIDCNGGISPINGFEININR